jgi:hemerythrin
MSYFPWKPEYSVHVTEIDTQHQKLIALMNDLYTAMQTGKGRQFVGEAVGKLAAYTKTHFATEEQLMLSSGYPGYAVHKKEHDEFVAKVGGFQAELQAGKIALTLEISTFLKDWLVRHILESDMNYTKHFNSKGIH